MKPYYQDDAVTIYHGDAREIVPTLDPVDLLLTDPPYGMAYSSGRAKETVYGGRYVETDGALQGDESTATRDEVCGHVDAPAIVFGRYGIVPPFQPSAVLVWDKGLACGMGDLSMPWKPNWELIFVRGRSFSGRRTSAVLSGYTVPARLVMGRMHPTEKPVPLLCELLSKSPPGVVLDPFAGSGSTLRAAKDQGRKAIGVEIEERYCEIAANRCAQECLPFGEME